VEVSRGPRATRDFQQYNRTNLQRFVLPRSRLRQDCIALEVLLIVRLLYDPSDMVNFNIHTVHTVRHGQFYTGYNTDLRRELSLPPASSQIKKIWVAQAHLCNQSPRRRSCGTWMSPLRGCRAQHPQANGSYSLYKSFTSTLLYISTFDNYITETRTSAVITLPSARLRNLEHPQR
jgi:hypothetical protein